MGEGRRMVGTFIWSQAVHSARKPPGEPTTHPGPTSSGSRAGLGLTYPAVAHRSLVSCYKALLPR